MAGLYPELFKACREMAAGMDSSPMTIRTRRGDTVDEQWLPLPFSLANGMSPEVEILAESNFEVARLRLEGSGLSDEPCRSRYDNWPGGRIETLMVRADDAGAVREAAAILAAIETYPILDEEHHSRLEWERWWSWWSGTLKGDVLWMLERDQDIPEQVIEKTTDARDGDGVEKWDNLLRETEWWQSHDGGISGNDVGELAAQIAVLLRAESGEQQPESTIMRDCRCCGARVETWVWGRCGACRAALCDDDYRGRGCGGR